ncbi:MAG: hypothetical protein HZB55_17490 [Deltaproteobacteria bacterium]|nr:hypothetical protein [Deltaproteobacteria bacterium]
MDIRLQFLVLNALINLLNENKTESNLKLISDVEKYLSAMDRRNVRLPDNATHLPFYQIVKITDNEWEARLNVGYESSFLHTKREAFTKIFEKLSSLKTKTEKALAEIQEIVADMKD